MTRRYLPIGLVTLLAILIAACAPAAAPSPTAVPPKPAATAAPAKTEAKPAATTAPAKPAATTAPAAAKPTDKPAPKPAFDEKAVSDFYKGKTIRVVVGFAPGAVFDTWARVLIRHMPKYIPGNPNMIVENMAGAASMTAANHVFKSAAKDGTVIGNFNEALIMNQLKKLEGVEFDETQFNWLGAISSATIACLARTDMGKGTINFQDILGPQGKQVILGSQAPGTSTWDHPMLFKQLLGANIKLVSGYPGNTQVRLAIESGEVEGYCGTWEAMLPATKPWKESGKPPFTVFVQEAASKDKDLPNVPMAHDSARSEADKQLFALQNSPQEFTRPFALPPGVPADRVAALRQAFMASFKDPALIEEAKKADLAFDPRTGETVLAKVKEILATPPDTVKRLKDVIGE
ncbi:MAG: hypothetical protein HY690_19910 [Chloroflexi bacterium]|nr:hypothetical protein [Chloroflexota bacterium]